MKLRNRLLLPLAGALMCIGGIGLGSLHLQRSWEAAETAEIEAQLDRERTLQRAQRGTARQALLLSANDGVMQPGLPSGQAFAGQQQLVQQQLATLDVGGSDELQALLTAARGEHARLGEASAADPSRAAAYVDALQRLTDRTQAVHRERLQALRSANDQAAWILWVALLGLLVVIGDLLAIAQSRLVTRPVELALQAARRIVQELDEDYAHGEDLQHFVGSIESMNSELHTQRAQVRDQQRQLETAHQLVAQAAQQRVEFLSAISHELRTPLNGVLGSLQLLQQGELSTDQMELAEVAQTSGQRLLDVLQSVSDLSNASSGSLVFECEPVDISKLIYEVVDQALPSAQRKGIQLHTSLPGLGALTVISDAERLRQIFENLIDNAVKFTSTGSVSVRGGGHVVDDTLHLSFEVEDTGTGIDEPMLDRIFDCLTIGADPLSRGDAGPGLGLALCQELVTLMGGQIAVQSVVDVGSTFTVSLELPLHTPDQAHAEILVVEDLPVSQLVLVQLLRTMGHEAVVADHGAAAKRILRRGGTRLVLLDIDLPDMDGRELATWIRNSGLNPQPKVVAVTASARATDRATCLAAGMDDYLAKPVHHDDLKGALARWMPKTRPTL